MLAAIGVLMGSSLKEPRPPEWVFEKLAENVALERQISIVSNRLSQPAIVYVDEKVDRVKFHFYDLDHWTESDFGDESGIETGAKICLAEPENIFWLGYVNGLNEFILTDWQNLEQRKERVVARADRPVLGIDLAIKKEQFQPAAAYIVEGSESEEDKIYYLAPKSGLPEYDWAEELVIEGDFGENISLALDNEERPWISFYGQSGQDLKVAKRLATGGWEVETIDDQGPVGFYNDLAVGRDNSPRAAFYDLTRGGLRYGQKDEGGWITAEIDDRQKLVGWYPTLDLDYRSNPSIVYYGERDDLVKIAEKNNSDGSWEKSEVTKPGSGGKFVGFSLSADEDPLVAYFNQHTNEVYYGCRGCVED